MNPKSSETNDNSFQTLAFSSNPARFLIYFAITEVCYDFVTRSANIHWAWHPCFIPMPPERISLTLESSLVRQGTWWHIAEQLSAQGTWQNRSAFKHQHWENVSPPCTSCQARCTNCRSHGSSHEILIVSGSPAYHFCCSGYTWLSGSCGCTGSFSYLLQ